MSDAFDGAGSSVTGALDSAGASVNSALDNASGALSGAQASAAAALDSFLGGINRESAAQQAAVAEKINNFLPKESLVPPAAQEQLSAVHLLTLSISAFVFSMPDDRVACTRSWCWLAPDIYPLPCCCCR